MTYLGYRDEAKKHGPAVAEHLHAFENAALGRYTDIVLKENIDCDLQVTRAFDAFYVKADAENAKLDLQARMAAYPESTKESDVRIYEDLETLERMTGLKGAVMGASFPAGHLWPYKLATSCEYLPNLTNISDSHCHPRRHEHPDLHSGPLYEASWRQVDHRNLSRRNHCRSDRHCHQRVHIFHPPRIQNPHHPSKRYCLLNHPSRFIPTRSQSWSLQILVRFPPRSG